MFTKEDIIQQLKAMNAPQDRVVLMHSALRCIGDVEGGAANLLSVLIEYFTKKGGLLCVPTHTANNLFSGKDITLDINDTATDLGAFSTVALENKTGIRSENPVLSMVVFGDPEKAAAFVKDDAFVTTPTAPEGCYAKIAEQNGYIFLVGVGQEKNTYLHSVAEMLNLPDRMDETAQKVTVKRADGEIVDRTVRMFQCSFMQDVSKRFPKYEIAFRYHGCITDGKLGNAPVQLCDAVKLKNTVELIFQNAQGADPLATEAPIPPVWFCRK